MKVLVEELLLLARLDQRRPADRVPVDLTVLGADACTDAVATAPDRSVTLDGPEPVVIAGDEVHLRQAIANLLTNALRHTPAGTPIEVSVRLDGRCRHGVGPRPRPGIDAEALAHVFDRFWQADQREGRQRRRPRARHRVERRGRARRHRRGRQRAGRRGHFHHPPPAQRIAGGGPTGTGAPQDRRPGTIGADSAGAPSHL